MDENSIVMITSDHTIPMGEHGIYHQEAGYYEESFRIPFFIHWPNHIEPEVIEAPFSQMDIAPTILDMLDINVDRHHFMGNSVFSRDVHPVYLIQPYGKHLSVIDWPHKFLWHGRSGDLSVYHLVNDPNETTNISDQVSDAQHQWLQSKLSYIYLVQKVYKHNEVFK